MIPRAYILEGRQTATWLQDVQIEQDLIISRALVGMFSHPRLRDGLAFRGGTALSSCICPPPDIRTVSGLSGNGKRLTCNQWGSEVVSKPNLHDLPDA